MMSWVIVFLKIFSGLSASNGRYPRILIPLTTPPIQARQILHEVHQAAKTEHIRLLPIPLPEEDLRRDVVLGAAPLLELLVVLDLLGETEFRNDDIGHALALLIESD